MNEVTRASRITAAIQVIQCMNEGLSVSQACKEVGMPRSSYYAIIAREGDAIAEFQDMVLANNQANLWLLISKQTEILHKLIQDALADTTRPRDRLAIYNALSEYQGRLVEELRIHNPGNVTAPLDFTGPKLRLSSSRFSIEKVNPDEFSQVDRP